MKSAVGKSTQKRVHEKLKRADTDNIEKKLMP